MSKKQLLRFLKVLSVMVVIVLPVYIWSITSVITALGGFIGVIFIGVILELLVIRPLYEYIRYGKVSTWRWQ